MMFNKEVSRYMLSSKTHVAKTIEDCRRIKSRSIINDPGQERELLHSLLPLAERDKKCPVI